MSYRLSAFAGVGAQLFTDSATTLSGGLIYVYSAGTTTLVNTYTDNTGANPNTNPIILDSAGRTPSEVWVDAGATYKFVVKTSTGTLVGTYDNVPGLNDITSVAWSAVTGTPTTLAGYGITDSITAATAAATYAPIASPAFTGTATAADDAGSQNTLGWRDCPQVAKTVSYQLVLSDRGKSIVMNNAALTLTIPANSAVAFPLGTTIVIININAAALTIAITSDTLTLANSASTGSRSLAQNGIATIIKTGNTSWLISGNGVT